MSEHLDRQRRRDIRRAMGPEALDLVQQEMRTVAALDEQVTLMMRSYKAQWQAMDRRVLALEQHEDHRVGQCMTLWGRLRWLWRG